MKRIVLSGFVLALMATPAWAQTPPAAPAPPQPSIELGGLVDVYYDYYSTKHTGDATFRNFDTKHNQFALSMAQVWLAKAPTADSRIGFKFKMNYGPAGHNYIHFAEQDKEAYQNVQEAYISYLAPAGKGLQIDAGVFVTPAGAEVIEAKDNMNYSRGLLFSLAIPYYHSGVRFSYAPSDKVSFMAGITNGWSNIGENNSGKTILGSVTFKPNAKVSIVENYIFGPEQAGNSDDYRHLSDTIVSIAATPKVTFTANYDYAKESIGNGTSVKWHGLAAYLKFQATPTVAFSPRFEWYNDVDGFTTGTAQKLKEITGTLEVKAADNLLWRIELRRDMSDQKPFLDDKGVPTGNQTSIGFGLLYSFSSKIQ
jgi:hypothetical protein